MAIARHNREAIRPRESLLTRCSIARSRSVCPFLAISTYFREIRNNRRLRPAIYVHSLGNLALRYGAYRSTALIVGYTDDTALRGSNGKRAHDRGLFRCSSSTLRAKPSFDWSRTRVLSLQASLLIIQLETFLDDVLICSSLRLLANYQLKSNRSGQTDRSISRTLNDLTLKVGEV